MEINANDFTGCVYDALRWLHRLGQTHLHANLKCRKVWKKASCVHVRVSEQLLADTLAHLLMVKVQPGMKSAALTVRADSFARIADAIVMTLHV